MQFIHILKRIHSATNGMQYLIGKKIYKAESKTDP